MQKTKRQHYVPKAYLRRYLQGGSTIFVFDKGNRSVFRTHIHNVAQERYFYDLPAEILNLKNESPQFLENVFSAIETEYASVLDEILRSIVRKGRFSPKHKPLLAFFIVVQFLRTRAYRQVQLQLREAMVEVINQDLLAERGLRLGYGYKDESANHFIRLFDPELLRTLTGILLRQVWIVWRNKTTIPFYISDNPVVMASRVQQEAGFASPGVEVILPLNSMMLLSVSDRRYFSNLVKHDRKVRNLYDVTEVEYYNRLQVIKSFRQVYSATEHFCLAKQVCEEMPEVCDPDRRRVEVKKQGDLVKFSPR